MKKAFTMIELIFVIVIIGILAAVAIPKLASTRDDAEASTCIHEIGQFTQELAATYAKEGNANYKTTLLKDMTNVQIVTAKTDGNGLVGAVATALVPGTDITYACGGEIVVTYTGVNAGTDYNLTVAVEDAATNSPANEIAKKEVLDKMLNGLTSKVFTL